MIEKKSIKIHRVVATHLGLALNACKDMRMHVCVPVPTMLVAAPASLHEAHFAWIIDITFSLCMCRIYLTDLRIFTRGFYKSSTFLHKIEDCVVYSFRKIK